MISLGLDPSLRAYGFAVHDSSKSGNSRLINSGHEGTLPSSVPVARFLHFQALVTKLISEYDPEVIGIESPAYDAGPFQTVHFGLMMFSLVPIFERRKNCILFDPATLKYLAKADPSVKRGKMGKLDIQRIVQIDLNSPTLLNDNEADAYLIAKFTARFFNFKNGLIKLDDLTISEKKVFVERSKRVKTLKGSKIVRSGHMFKENTRFFEFSKVPKGNVQLPYKSQINCDIIKYLEDKEKNP